MFGKKIEIKMLAKSITSSAALTMEQEPYHNWLAAFHHHHHHHHHPNPNPNPNKPGLVVDPSQVFSRVSQWNGSAEAST